MVIQKIHVCTYDMNQKVCNLSGDDASCGIEEDNLHCAVYKWSSNTDAVSGTAEYRCSTESTNGFCPASVNGFEIFEERSDDSNIFDAIVSFFDSFGFICEYTSSLENGSVCYYDSQCISEWCKINDNSKGICTQKAKIMEPCNSDGSDNSCDQNSWPTPLYCAQFAENDYKCTNSAYTPTGAISEYAKNLSNGNGCKYDGQCITGWFYNNRCKALKNIGESCNEEGGLDFICSGITTKCAQYENNNYKCCDDAYIPFGSLSEWCYNLKKGDGCYYDGQCKGNLSCPSECVWVWPYTTCDWCYGSWGIPYPCNCRTGGGWWKDCLPDSQRKCK